MSSPNRDGFNSFFPISMTSISFFSRISLSRLSSTMLNTSGRSSYLYIPLDLRGKLCSLCSLSSLPSIKLMILAVSFSMDFLHHAQEEFSHAWSVVCFHDNKVLDFVKCFFLNL